MELFVAEQAGEADESALVERMEASPAVQAAREHRQKMMRSKSKEKGATKKDELQSADVIGTQQEGASKAGATTSRLGRLFGSFLASRPGQERPSMLPQEGISNIVKFYKDKIKCAPSTRENLFLTHHRKSS